MFPIHRPGRRRAIVTMIAALATFVGASAAHPQAKTVKLVFNNTSKVDIQVYTVDHNTRKTDENKRQISPGGQGTSQATLDSGGYIDVTFSVIGKNASNISEYRCVDVKTSANGKSELSYSLSMTSGRKC